MDNTPTYLVVALFAFLQTTLLEIMIQATQVPYTSVYCSHLIGKEVEHNNAATCIYLAGNLPPCELDFSRARS